MVMARYGLQTVVTARLTVLEEEKMIVGISGG